MARRARGYELLHTSPEQDDLLARIAGRVRGEADPVAVFDLDGCLFDTRWRQVHLLRELGSRRGWHERYRVGVEHFVGWNRHGSLVRGGIDAAWLDAHFDEVRAFWLRHFFAPDYVRHDHAMPVPPAWCGRCTRRVPTSCT